MKPWHWIAIGALAGLLIVVVPPPLRGQGSADDVADRALASRSELEQLAARLEAEHDTTTLPRVRMRLAQGDFHGGDRILLRVVAESTLTDTFRITDSSGVVLPPPVNAEIPLRGVLRAELAPVMTRELGRYLEHPVVSAHALLRMSIQGGVTKPGFYFVPADAPLSEAFMAAGGTSPLAKVRDAHLDREGHPLLPKDEFRQALAGGKTLDALWLRDGDEIVVPAERDEVVYGHLRFVWIVVSITAGLVGLSRVL